MSTALARIPPVLVCAVGLGLIAWAADHVSSDSTIPVAAGLGNFPSHWLLTAFLVGAIARRKLAGATLATLGLALAVIVYYGAIKLSGERADADLTRAAQAWLAVAIVAGPAFGLAGATWISGPNRYRPWAVALLAGALAGEAIYLADNLGFLARFTLDDSRTLFAVVDGIAALLLPFLMLRRAGDRATALLATLVCALAMALVIAVVVDSVRYVLSPF